MSQFIKNLKIQSHSNLFDDWFWNNYNDKIRIWIGKSIHSLRIPEDYDIYLSNLISNICDIDDIYIKFYLTKNIYGNELVLNYLLVCENIELPKKFINSLIYSIFESYDITNNMISNHPKLKSIINYYLKWTNYYPNYSFIKQIDNSNL